LILKRLLLGLVITLSGLSLYAQEPAKVIKVVDGDTLKIELNGKKESIRLIGIDTPESKANNKAYKDAYKSKQTIKTITGLGKRATAYVKTLVKQGDTISIEFDIEKLDRYKRLLGYVYLSSGEMLNEEIIKAGYANIMTYPPNIKYVDRFQRAYKEAREAKLGLWK
jgi:micrococcal nuclease